MPHRRVVRLLFVVFLGAFLSSATSARADDAEKTRKAKAHYKQGQDYYAAEAWDLAIEEYKKAYDLLPLPAFQFNIAQAYRLKGDKKQALEHYRMYLELDPNGKASDEARRHVGKRAGRVAS